MNQLERAQKVCGMYRDLAIKLVFQWTKTGVITVREFDVLTQLVQSQDSQESILRRYYDERTQALKGY